MNTHRRARTTRLAAIGLPDACLAANSGTVLLASSGDGTVPEWDPANGHCDATYSWIRSNGQRSARASADSPPTLPHAGDSSSCICATTLRGRFASMAGCSRSVPIPMLPPLPHRDDGLMAVPVPQGHVELDGRLGDHQRRDHRPLAQRAWLSCSSSDSACSSADLALTHASR